MLAVCIANGASLTQEDVNKCSKADRVYAVKEAIYMAPWADALYAADWDWWDLKKGCQDFQGEKWTCADESVKKWGLRHIKANNRILWGTGDEIATGGNSGFQAINLAYIHGASGIILLGYDYGLSTKKHWFDGTELERQSRESNYTMWLEHIEKASKVIPIPIYNCTRETNIACFPRMRLEDAFLLHGAI